MPENTSSQKLVLEKLRSSGAINFDKIGEAVTAITPQVFDPGTEADDYIATGYTSVIKVWQTGLTMDELARPAELNEMVARANQLAADVQRVAGQGRVR